MCYCSGLMVGVLGYCVVFLGITLYFHSASLYPDNLTKFLGVSPNDLVFLGRQLFFKFLSWFHFSVISLLLFLTTL